MIPDPVPGGGQTTLSCGHLADPHDASLPSDLDGLRICRACHGDAARAVLAGLRPGAHIALYRSHDGRQLVTWYDEPMMTITLESPTWTVVWAVDEQQRMWRGRCIGRTAQYLCQLTNVTMKGT